MRVALLAALAATACAADERRDLDLRVEGVDPTTALIVGRILRGGCEGSEVFVAAHGPGAPAMMSPPVLEPGTYGFEACAYDAECRRFACACIEKTLPLADGDELVLRPEPETPTTECEHCAMGPCAGGGDGGVDGGPDGGCPPAFTTPDHCGDCGRRCHQGDDVITECTAGDCVYACSTGYDDCDGDLANGRDETMTNGCEPLDTPENCGACGVACEGATPFCTGSVGAATCEANCMPPTPDPCPDGCVDFQTDPQNCGGCDIVCEPPTRGTVACVMGMCVPSCDTPGWTVCGRGASEPGACADTRANNQHCGGCGQPCDPRFFCSGGRCCPGLGRDAGTC